MGKHANGRPRVAGLLASRKKPVIDENVRKERVIPLIASLKSMNTNERNSALTAINGLLDDHNMRHMLLRERLIKVILSNILSDSSLEIIAQGLGVLRNVVLLEGRDPALFLLRENVMIPLANISTKAVSSIGSGSSSLDAEQKKILNLISENAFGLVSAIVIFVGNVKGFDKTIQLGVELIRLASNDSIKIPPKCTEAAFEMLYYVSEISMDVLTSYSSLEEFQRFKSFALKDPASTWSTRVYSIGIECNFFIVNGEESIDPQASALEVASFLNSVPKSEKNAVQISLELLAVLAQTEDPELVTSLISQIGGLILENLILETDFQLPSVSVLNNLGWALNALNQDWKSDAQSVYETAVTNCFKQLEDTELVSSALGLVNATLVQDPTLVDNPAFKELFYKILVQADSLFQSNDPEWIALGRVIVLIFGAGNGPTAFKEMIDPTVKMIILLLEFSNDVEAQIDALEGLFGIFGDNDSPHNHSEYVEKGVQSKLESLKPNLKRTLKSPPKSCPELRKQGLEALQNFDNFLIYKRS